MREFYPFTRVQVSAITMRANIFRFLMAITYGSHGSHVWLASMARPFGSLGSHVWLAWLAWLARLARLARMARTFGSLGSHVWLAWLAGSYIGNSRRRAPPVRKTFEKLVTDSLCSVPCYPAKHAFIVIFIYDILLSR